MYGIPFAKTKSLMVGIYSHSKITLIDSHAMMEAKKKNA
jgi:hypothetical protein